VYDYIGVVSVVIKYNCVYYCDTWVLCIGVVSVFCQYHCVYYCDTPKLYLLLDMDSDLVRGVRAIASKLVIHLITLNYTTPTIVITLHLITLLIHLPDTGQRLCEGGQGYRIETCRLQSQCGPLRHTLTPYTHMCIKRHRVCNRDRGIGD
jgi:hypothetical protein